MSDVKTCLDKTGVAITKEISEAVELLTSCPDVLAISVRELRNAVASWGSTHDDGETLQALKLWNERGLFFKRRVEVAREMIAIRKALARRWRTGSHEESEAAIRRAEISGDSLALILASHQATIDRFSRLANIEDVKWGESVLERCYDAEEQLVESKIAAGRIPSLAMQRTLNEFSRNLHPTAIEEGEHDFSSFARLCSDIYASLCEHSNRKFGVTEPMVLLGREALLNSAAEATEITKDFANRYDGFEGDAVGSRHFDVVDKIFAVDVIHAVYNAMEGSRDPNTALN